MSTRAPYGNYAHAVLTNNAARTPDDVALVYRGQSYSFDALNRRVNRTANALRALGVEPGQKVASLLGEALHVAETYFAEAKIGAVIAAFNPYWAPDMVVEMARRSKVDWLTIDAPNAKFAQTVRAELPEVRLIAVGTRIDGAVSLDDALAQASDEEPPLGAFFDDPMGFFYTSGTTGTSKAVVHSHSSCIQMSTVLYEVERSTDSVWGSGPIIWGIGFPCTIGAAFYAGMKVALEDDLGPARLLEAVQRERISHITMIPSQWADILSNHPHQDFDLSSLKVILLGGEPISPNIFSRLMERLPGLSLYSFYGQSEGPYNCVNTITEAHLAATSGRARVGQAVRTIGANGERVVGVPGEIVMTGPHLFQGYDGQPDKTAEVLKDGWFHTGDLGLMDESGRLTVLGRKEDAISRGGHYLRPIQIEDVAGTIEGVAEAGVAGSPAGAPEQKIILAVSPQPGATLDEAGLRARLEALLPAEAMPDLIVVADSLPHGNDASGGRGKLLRREIRALYEGRLAG
jgi:fatty-acyl-CoA synthase